MFSFVRGGDLSIPGVVNLCFVVYVRMCVLLGGIGDIKANPDKSQGLKTATLKIFDQAIDVNNLRTETYDDESRIPQMVFNFLPPSSPKTLVFDSKTKSTPKKNRKLELLKKTCFDVILRSIPCSTI